MSNKVYIYVVNRKVPSKKVVGKWDTYEEVSIKSKIIPKLYDSATFVLEVIGTKLEKNRFEHDSDKEYTFDTVVKYLSTKHESVRELMQSYNELMGMYNKAIENMKNKDENEQSDISTATEVDTTEPN